MTCQESKSMVYLLIRLLASVQGKDKILNTELMQDLLDLAIRYSSGDFSAPIELQVLWDEKYSQIWDSKGRKLPLFGYKEGIIDKTKDESYKNNLIVCLCEIATQKNSIDYVSNPYLVRRGFNFYPPNIQKGSFESFLNDLEITKQNIVAEKFIDYNNLPYIGLINNDVKKIYKTDLNIYETNTEKLIKTVLLNDLTYRNQAAIVNFYDRSMIINHILKFLIPKEKISVEYILKVLSLLTNHNVSDIMVKVEFGRIFGTN